MTFEYHTILGSQRKLLDNYDPWARKVKLSELVDRGVSAIEQTGSYGNAQLVIDDFPVDGDIVGIGIDNYEWDDGGGVAPGNYPVLIGASAAECRANLVLAINSLGHESVLAFDVPPMNSICVVTANRPGGEAVVGYQPITLTETITPATCIWNQTSLGSTGIFHTQRMAYDYVVLNATNSVTPFLLIFPFEFQIYTWKVINNPTNTEILTTGTVENVSTTALLVTPNTGGTPMVAGNLLFVQVFE